MIIKSCLKCKKSFRTFPYAIEKGNGKFCSRLCAIKFNARLPSRINKLKTSLKGVFLGKRHPNWKGGRFNFMGYVLIYCLGHPHPNHQKHYVFEHRLVAEKCLGRYLLSKEQIHHINKVKKDNRPENLYLFTIGAHTRFHGFKNPPKLISNLIGLTLKS